MSKIEKAKQIVSANPKASRSELIGLFMSELAMSKAGATTYYYNATAETRQPSTRMKNKEKRIAVVAKANAAKPKTTAEAVAKFAKSKAKTAEQILKEEEKRIAANKLAAAKAEARKGLDAFEADIEGYTFPNGTLSDAQVKVKEKNLELMKEVSAKRKGGNYIVV